MAQLIKTALKKILPVEWMRRRRFLKENFATEMALIAGNHHNDNKHPSILHFSFNKAATQFVKSVLVQCAERNGMVPVEIHEYAFHSDFPYLDHLTSQEMKRYQHLFKSRGYLYSVFGGMIEGIPNLQDYKVVLMVRDPRDLLVSEYYSVAHSHPVPSAPGDKREVFLALRDTAQSSSIDDYVLGESDKIVDNLNRYQSLLLDKHPNALVTSYGQMTSDFDSWLRRLIDYCEFEVSPEFLDSLSQRNRKAKPKSEDVSQHIRKGKPGDYKEKLQPETIRKLDEKFEPFLRRFWPELLASQE